MPGWVYQPGQKRHTVVGIRTTHHEGHGVPPRSIPQLTALDEVVNRPIDLCEEDMLADMSKNTPQYSRRTKPASQRMFFETQETFHIIGFETGTIHRVSVQERIGTSLCIPSNWDEKAGISSRWEIELDPNERNEHEFLTIYNSTMIPDLPDRDGGTGCSQETWRAAGACQP